ncbi:ER protein Pkr1-domain-containing protein [Umbelopsis sp. AD052]|nr:ER protein Pkr1-domain-containing protein [Umbelopsis sp. AD052]
MSEPTIQIQDDSRKDGLVNDIIESIMTPGYTPNSVIQLMYKAFYALFFTLFLLLIGTSGNLHVLALLIISICLFLSVRWFINEMETIKLAEAKDKGDQAKSGKAE